MTVTSDSGQLASAPLALTMGDPAGIGPDITLTAWVERNRRSLAPFVFFGDPDALGARARALGYEVTIKTVSSLAEGLAAFATHLPVIAVPCAAVVAAGKPDPANAAAIIASIEQAVAAVQRGEARAVVTNPIAKSVLMAEGFPYPGHTEFLGALSEKLFGAADVHPVMLLASSELKVVPLTVHIPLADVPKAITSRSIVATAQCLHRSLQTDFGIANPRIAVTGLNPHAGEDGKIGHEDERIIAIAIAALRDGGMAVTGPHPADTLFHAAARETYDAVLAMYHDQALIPIKTLAFDTGVNVTIGLPFVRTSPDHGTAFSIAGTGQARASSLVEALRLADTMAARRMTNRSEHAG
ncbi:4-hydroxythreonine-4-phosphate dehydrogenase PdxA [Hyphomicrobium sp.]|uniref:4-hydroxythreonine-4-phosphate dehydrogenase PdxA n=1 Tax=Hyphomicrobium sp. TaxID=82 RepID=UPI002E310586|nr:4-hydroxythreonine-4-phosphate dehydrogenase PdxA [Hyphomicrobium sp.]HEX2843038.1 4-hydroxythreonine-4-phosphate dehydrogenase PdxA [Hyphomicrobium sp.]